MLFAAVAGALAHAGLTVRAGEAAGCVRHERIGLFVGTGQLPARPAETFWASALERGFDRASGPAFSTMVLNAPAGAVGRALELRGPLSVIADGEGAGLVAAVLAREWLRRRRDVDVLVVASAFEIGRAVRDAHADPRLPRHEASAAVVLARASWAERAAVEPRLRVHHTSLQRAGDTPCPIRNDAADLVALVDACEQARRRHGEAVASATGPAGTRATLSLAPATPAPCHPAPHPFPSHRKATHHG